MNQLRRVFFQAILWLLIFVILWLSQGGNARFFIENVIILLFQILLIYVLVYLIAPNFLFKKKYLMFALYSLFLLLLATLISTKLLGEPPLKPPPRRGMPPGLHIPSRFFINFLILNAGYLLATFFETILFAQSKEKETIQNKNEQLQTELKLLKSQINPHFLFNSLNNIYALSVINSDRTQESISNLSDMLRYVLYECDQQLVLIEKEITYIENYIKLFSLKSSKSYLIKLDVKLSEPGLIIAPMLFIPFVENALKHSNIEKNNDSFINIYIEANSKIVKFEIENSLAGKTIIKDALGGIGIENVKKRLNILYPEAHQLTIVEADKTFKVKLTVNMSHHA